MDCRFVSDHSEFSHLDAFAQTLGRLVLVICFSLSLVYISYAATLCTDIDYSE